MPTLKQTGAVFEFSLKRNDAVLLKRLVWWLVAWLVLLPFQGAGACTPALITVNCAVPENVQVAQSLCLDSQCNAMADEGAIVVDNEPFGVIGANYIQTHPYFEKLAFEAADTVCGGALSVSKQVQSLYANWEISDSRFFYVEAYSSAKEENLIEIQQDLLSCRDVEYVKDNDTLSYIYTTKSYCTSSITPFSLAVCGGAVVISPIRLAGFALANPSSETLPIIAFTIMLLAVLIGGSGYLYRQGELKKFFAPSKLHTVGLLVGVPIVCALSFFILPYLSYQLAGLYLFLSIVNYTRMKRSSHEN